MTPNNASYLGNIAFWCVDFPAMRHFYSEILGLPELAYGERPRYWVFYGNNTFNFSLNQAEFSPENRGWARCPMNPALGESWEPYITVYVSDLEATMDRCREKGVPMHSETPFSLGEGFGHSIEVKDPEGRTIAITQRAS